jgi:hypothetical protein
MNLLKSLSFLALLATAHVAANEVQHHSGYLSSRLGYGENSVGSMYLGEWKNDIVAKIMPRYFEDIAKDSSRISSSQPSLLPTERYNSYLSRTTSIVFSKDSNIFKSNNGLLFSFQFESLEPNEFALNEILGSHFSKSKISKFDNVSNFVNQQTYVPGYSYTYGLSSFGFAAVLVQQNFIDSTFGSMTLESSNSSSLYNDRVLFETNRGIGYQLSYSLNLPFKSNFNLNYQSKIEMNEFGSNGNGYRDPGDFDIPEYYTLALNIPVIESNIVNFSSQRILYSDIAARVHNGYSEDFLRLFNSPVQPTLVWDNLTVYTLGYKRIVSDETSWSLDMSSRQQAPATDEFLNQILNNDTAEYSYKISLKQQLAGGELNLFASYADKPVLIGRTDFGRFTQNNLDSHVEAGISWNLYF